MQDFQQLQDSKARCIADLTEALPRYRDRLDAIDPRLTAYITDALSGNASHANLSQERLTDECRSFLFFTNTDLTD